MRKRIGSKLYDTDSALIIIPEKNLYRTQKNQTYFIYDGNNIFPLNYHEAEKIIYEFGNEETKKYLSHKPDVYGRAKINISAASAERLSAYCRRHKVSQKQVVEDLIDSLPDD